MNSHVFFSLLFSLFAHLLIPFIALFGEIVSLFFGCVPFRIISFLLENEWDLCFVVAAVATVAANW